MEPEVHNLLSDLAPGFFVTQLSLLVDRVYVRETITQVGDPPRDVKEWAGVELICWDDAGTRVLCSVMTHEALAVLGHMLSSRKTYMVSSFSVAEPGYGIHSRFHILFDEKTIIKHVSAPFVDRVFDIRTPSDLPTSQIDGGLIYDVCGYVRHASPVVPVTRGGYVEMEFLLLLESRVKGSDSNLRCTAIVHLRGSWVEAEYLKISDMLQHRENQPFILIKRLLFGRPTRSGRPILHSICHATKFVYDIAIQEVLEKRAELICG